MRIIENYTGGQVTYTFDPGYDIKTFYQEVEIPSDNYEVKLVNMFAKNSNSFFYRDIDMTNFAQYVKIDWADGVIFKTPGTVVVNSGCFNPDGEVIKHTFSKKGKYLIKITSVEDLVVVPSSFDYIKNGFNADISLSMKTKRIGGKINRYIPPEASINIGIFNNIENEITKLMLSDDPGVIANKVSINGVNVNTDKLVFKPSWVLSVSSFEGMYSPLEFKYTDNSDWSYFFCKWQSASAVTEDTIYTHLDDTLYNMFREKRYMLDLTGMFAHANGVLKASRGGDIGEVLKDYAFEYTDYTLEYVDDIVCSYKFLFWNVRPQGNITLDAFKNDMKYWGLNSLISKYPDMLKGTFGLVNGLGLSKPFDFTMLMTKPEDGTIDSEVIGSNLDMSYFMFGSNIRLAPIINIDKIKFFNTNIKRFNIKLDRAFMCSMISSKSDSFSKESVIIDDNTEVGYIPIPGLINILNNKIDSVNISAKEMLVGLTRKTLVMDADSLFTGISSSKNPSKISLFYDNERIESILPDYTQTGTFNIDLEGCIRLNDNFRPTCYLIGTDLNVYSSFTLYHSDNNNSVATNRAIEINQIYKDLYKSNKTARTLRKMNPLINTRTDNEGLNFKNYIDMKNIKIGSNMKFSNSIDYTSIFENVSLHASLDHRYVIQPIGQRFLMDVSTVGNLNQYNNSNIVMNLNIDRICYNSDVVTKEIISKSMATYHNLSIEAVKDKKIYYNKKTESMFKISSAIKSFMNDYDVITASCKGGSKAAYGLDYRDRSRYKNIRLNNAGNDSYYGFTLDTSFFSTENNFVEGCSLEDCFRNNISIVFQENLPHNDNFTIHLDKHNMSGMFSIDDQLSFMNDKNGSWKYSEFRNNPEVDNELFIRQEGKYAYIFDNFRIFKMDHIDINKMDLIDIISSMNLSNIFKGRMFTIEPIQGLLLYNTNMKYENSYFINGVEYNNGTYNEGLHTLTPNKISEEVNKILGASGGIIYKLTEDDMCINYTPGYVHNIMNIYDEETSGMKLKVKFRDNSFSVCDISNSDLMNAIGLHYQNTYGSRGKVKCTIEVDGRIMNKEFTNTVANAEGFIEFLSVEIFDVTSVNYGNLIYDTRTYVSLNKHNTDVIQCFPMMILTNNIDKEVDSSILTSMMISSDTDSELNRIISMNNISILNNVSYSYLSPISGFVAFKMIPRFTGDVSILNNFNNSSMYIAYRDFFDYFYNKEWMNSVVDTHIIQGESNLNKVCVLRDNDLKFMSYFKIVNSIRIGGDGLTTIDANGLIHNSYAIDGMYTSKLDEIYKFGCEPHANLKLILGRMVNIPGDPGVERCTNMKNPTITPLSLLIHQFFTSNSIKDIEYMDPEFLSNISSLNSNIANTITVLSLYKGFLNTYIKNYEAFVSMFKGNALYMINNMFGGCTDSPSYIEPYSFDDITKDDINIYVSNIPFKSGRIDGVAYPSNMNIFTSCIIKPLVLDASIGSGITFKTCRALQHYTTNPAISFNQLNNLVNIGESKVSEYANPFIIKIKDDRNEFDSDYSSESLKVNGGVIQSRARYETSAKLINKFGTVFSKGFVEFGGSDNMLDITSPYEYEEHYLNRFIFNKLSSNILTFNDIVTTIYDNGNAYGMHIKGFILNKSCNLKYVVDGVEHSINYGAGAVINLNVMSNNRVDKTLELIEVKDIVSENDDLLTIDIKIGIRKDISVKNQERFKPRIFVKDNLNKIFEMQRLFFKKNKDVTGNWNINVHKSNLTRDIKARDVLGASSYNGENLFTDNLVNIKYRLEKGYLNNNSLGFNIDENKDSYVLYCINDTPFSTENSDGYIYKIEGPLVYDISKFNVISNGLLDLEYILRSLCNTNVVDYVDPKLFDNFDKDGVLTSNLKVKLGSFHIKNIDLKLLNPFKNNIIGIVDSFNNKDVFSTIIGNMNTSKDLVIEGSFNCKLSTTGLISNTPFILANLTKVIGSFNFDESSVNTLIPKGFLDSKQTNNLEITSSFNNCVIMDVLKTRGVNTGTSLNVNVSGSFNNSIYEDLFNVYGKYILNYILNYSKKIVCNDIGTISSLSYESISNKLDVIQTNIDNDLIDNLDTIDLEDGRVHTKLYVNY